MKAVLLENHPLLRAGLAQVLAHPALGLEVSAPEWPHESPPPADLLVVGVHDANAPLDAARLRDLIAQSTPRHVVVLAAQVSAEEAHAAMVCGADAYVAKTQPTEVLLATLQLVLAGGQAYPALVPRPASGPDVAAPTVIGAAEAAQRLNVSQRQYEVLVLLSRGHSVKGVGRLLGISEATVKTHACTLYRRLNVRNKSEAVYAAMRLGIPLELPGNPAMVPAADRLPDAPVRAGVPRVAIEAVEPACVPPRPVAGEHAAESRWAAMTRAFGMTDGPNGGRVPVRVANGAPRPGLG
ncbi:response regulator transcription factor [Ralstonia solanacearum]|uniref:response regulator transcription factor n=1 Tax=Ralstonia solanacearum TaxID=305 RepID=UPI00031F9848|nr:response regulator transcription factor [Ralstonia solanacearum]MDC6213144.1 response regulator transcription factor [Ralstonia solanacearum]MDC6242053.1 response regulator transcription factor [Ralstonia solanacearum]MDD7803755.1 response regulator transcription factor [Ralstonia solanacearum]